MSAFSAIHMLKAAEVKLNEVKSNLQASSVDCSTYNQVQKLISKAQESLELVKICVERADEWDVERSILNALIKKQDESSDSLEEILVAAVYNIGVANMTLQLGIIHSQAFR